jgi:hypothetical protein
MVGLLFLACSVHTGEKESIQEFTFVRVEFNWAHSGELGAVGPWAHDYPIAEENLLKELSRLTSITKTDYIVLRLDAPETLNYPVLYVSEPGH